MDGIAGFALLDTGADRTVVDHATALQAGLVPVATVPFQRYDSHKRIDSDGFEAELELSGIGSWSLEQVGSLELARFSLLAIIGRDILNDLVLVYNGPAKKVNLERYESRAAY